MKIIGETTGGFILEANKDEIANLKGFSVYYLSKEQKALQVDDVIEIGKVYDRYKSFENLIKSSGFKDALNRLKDTVAVLTPVEELFNQTKEIIK